MKSGVQEAVDQVGSQAKLAALLGVSKVLVSRWVHRGWVSRPAALRIEEQLGIPRTRLLDPALLLLLQPA